MFLAIPLLISLIHFDHSLLLSLIFIELVSVFIIYGLIEYFVNEIKNDGKGSIFLVILALIALRDAILQFITLETIVPSLLFHSVFLAVNIALLIPVAIAGPEKKIKIPSFFLRKMNVKISENGIPLNNNNLELARKKLKPIVYGLTDREIDVLKLLADGLTSQEISEKLFLSKKTVDYYRGSIKLKLNIQKKISIDHFL